MKVLLVISAVLAISVASATDILDTQFSVRSNVVEQLSEEEVLLEQARRLGEDCTTFAEDEYEACGGLSNEACEAEPCCNVVETECMLITEAPSSAPTQTPTVTTNSPTRAPSDSPTTAPSQAPSTVPTSGPTDSPTPFSCEILKSKGDCKKYYGDKLPGDCYWNNKLSGNTYKCVTITAAPSASPTVTTDAPTALPTSSPTVFSCAVIKKKNKCNGHKDENKQKDCAWLKDEEKCVARTLAPSQAPSVIGDFDCVNIQEKKPCQNHKNDENDRDCIWFKDSGCATRTLAPSEAPTPFDDFDCKNILKSDKCKSFKIDDEKVCTWKQGQCWTITAKPTASPTEFSCSNYKGKKCKKAGCDWDKKEKTCTAFPE